MNVDVNWGWNSIYTELNPITITPSLKSKINHLQKMKVIESDLMKKNSERLKIPLKIIKQKAKYLQKNEIASKHSLGI